MEQKDFFRDPEMNKLWKDIAFLTNKLLFLKEEIDSEYKTFVEKVVKTEKANVLSKMKDMKIDKGNSIELKLESAFIGVEANSKLFYLLDSFLIDLKRIVEFNFRLVSFSVIGKNIKEFSLEKQIMQLSGTYDKELSNLSKQLMANNLHFVEFIRAHSEALFGLNNRRTRAIHYEVFNKVGGFKIEFFWNSIKKFEDEPEITFPDLPFFKKPIPLFVKDDIELIKSFISEVYKISEPKMEKRIVL